MAVNTLARKNRGTLGPDQLRAVADLFTVLSEPTRLRILQQLHDGPASVGEIVSQLDIKQANASKQLGILHQAGVLAREKEGNQVRYSIRMPLVFDLCTLVCNGLRKEAELKAKALA